ncbi:alpha/beta hydrolase [Pseudonocardia sulfidoxydans NBRC 16205]|uniref:Alpha/beta hydrolase n=1 Tax=Pseudonocardia sulfidoxydans NBRC 16205 TaxID=1223511 RepID=A0A511DLW0_9PSEU|nr:alpha/beta hydrolase [Pseudonocardia sulfidoxydans]GEL25800.1 alpha/beta hydrolase [Pseudonocardia sulfidoxydans NBRC 16205]
MRRSLRTSDGVYLAVVEFGGGGTPILLLHGLMGRATTWWPVARRLTGHGRVIGLDARGHGRSQATGPWTTERLAADAAELLDQLGAGPAIVVGHSMGGLHALALAASRPDLVQAVVVEDMAVDLTGVPETAVADARAWFGAIPQPFASLAEVRATFGHPRPEFGDYMAECVEERADGYHLLCRVDNAVEIAGEWAYRSYWDVLAGVRAPVLLVCAAAGIVPRGQPEQIVDALRRNRFGPYARLVTLPGTGHLVHASEEAFRIAVEDFLATTAPLRAS